MRILSGCLYKLHRLSGPDPQKTGIEERRIEGGKDGLDWDLEDLWQIAATVQRNISDVFKTDYVTAVT